MRLYEVVFDESQDKGVYALSCVGNPAMEDTWLALADHPKEIQFSTIDEEKRLLLGASLIPNKKIYRNDNGDEYYLTFSEDTIERCAHSFVRNNYVQQSSENHDVKLEGVSVVESWIVEDPEKDKSAHYGKKYEKGTWVTMMKVDNDDTWEKAKNGTLNGFSIDGLFSLKEMSLNKNEFIMDKKTLLETIKEGLLSFSKKEEVTEVKFGQVTLKDGSTKIEYEGESLEVGLPVFLVLEDGEKVAAPEGEHELDNGEFIYVDSNGLIKEAPIKEEVKEEVSDAEMVAELMKALEGFKAEFSKEMEVVKSELQSHKVEMAKSLEVEVAKTKEVDTQLQAEKVKNIELEAKLEKEPAAGKIVKTEFKVAEPKNAKQRLLNVALEAFNKN
jgi:hypothetical protein